MSKVGAIEASSIWYPDLASASAACVTPTATSCDETNKYFADYTAAHPGVIKIVSPGKKTGDFQPLGFPIFTYDAPTLGGQSGSPVIDLQTNKIIGLHYCCTGAPTPPNEPSCASIAPLSLGDKSENEALAIKDVTIPH